jgi:transposase
MMRQYAASWQSNCPKVWSVVRVPSVAEEDARRLHRECDRLINERVQHVNRVKGLCAVHGIYDYEPLRSNRMLRLEQSRTNDGRKLPPYLKAEIVRELRRLELVLTPSHFQSGPMSRDQGISKAGNPKARTVHDRTGLDLAPLPAQ